MYYLPQLSSPLLSLWDSGESNAEIGLESHRSQRLCFCLFACLFIRLLSLCCLMWLVSMLPVSSSGIVSSIPSILMLSPFTELILVIDYSVLTFPTSSSTYGPHLTWVPFTTFQLFEGVKVAHILKKPYIEF